MSLLDRFLTWIEKRGGMREIWRIENGAEVLYLKRFYLYRFRRLGEGMIHVFMRGDAGAVHDHPFSSWGWILTKGYWEVLVNKLTSGYDPFGERRVWRGPGHFGYRPSSIKAHDNYRSYHKVVLKDEDIDKGTVKTAFFTGPRNKFGWGFWSETVKNYVPFYEYKEDNSTKNRSPDDYTYGLFPVYKPKRPQRMGQKEIK